jgi:hypothetical protein
MQNHRSSLNEASMTPEEEAYPRGNRAPYPASGGETWRTCNINSTAARVGTPHSLPWLQPVRMQSTQRMLFSTSNNFRSDSFLILTMLHLFPNRTVLEQDQQRTNRLGKLRVGINSRPFRAESLVSSFQG